jgi:predicted transposase YdaD
MPDHVEKIMQGFGQQYFEEGVAVGEARGKAQGKAEGMAQGKAEGKAQLLVRLLEKRFGAVLPERRSRIFAADLATIDAWFDRAVVAADLESVFDPN